MLKAKDVVISGITFNQTKGVAAINVYNASGVTIENTQKLISMQMQVLMDLQ